MASVACRNTSTSHAPDSKSEPWSISPVKLKAPATKPVRLFIKPEGLTMAVPGQRKPKTLMAMAEFKHTATGALPTAAELTKALFGGAISACEARKRHLKAPGGPCPVAIVAEPQTPQNLVTQAFNSLAKAVNMGVEPALEVPTKDGPRWLPVVSPTLSRFDSECNRFRFLVGVSETKLCTDPARNTVFKSGDEPVKEKEEGALGQNTERCRPTTGFGSNGLIEASEALGESPKSCHNVSFIVGDGVLWRQVAPLLAMHAAAGLQPALLETP